MRKTKDKKFENENNMSENINYGINIHVYHKQYWILNNHYIAVPKVLDGKYS